jgi:hypothetical protein
VEQRDKRVDIGLGSRRDQGAQRIQLRERVTGELLDCEQGCSVSVAVEVAQQCSLARAGRFIGAAKSLADRRGIRPSAVTPNQ